jgi:lipid-A-disaccharide synthase-like uncharacterized protein
MIRSAVRDDGGAIGAMEGEIQMSWTDIPNLWLAVGFAGQMAFSARFLVQWIVSEARRESVIPIPFWYFSLVGGSLLLIYAIHRKDPVFIVGQGAGLIIYTRNLVLISRRRRQEASGGPGSA